MARILLTRLLVEIITPIATSHRRRSSNSRLPRRRQTALQPFGWPVDPDVNWRKAISSGDAYDDPSCSVPSLTTPRAVVCRRHRLAPLPQPALQPCRLRNEERRAHRILFCGAAVKAPPEAEWRRARVERQAREGRASFGGRRVVKITAFAT